MKKVKSPTMQEYKNYIQGVANGEIKVPLAEYLNPDIVKNKHYNRNKELQKRITATNIELSKKGKYE